MQVVPVKVKPKLPVGVKTGNMEVVLPRFSSVECDESKE
jgi:hypothetical protein